VSLASRNHIRLIPYLEHTFGDDVRDQLLSIFINCDVVLLCSKDESLRELSEEIGKAPASHALPGRRPTSIIRQESLFDADKLPLYRGCPRVRACYNSKKVSKTLFFCTLFSDNHKELTFRFCLVCWTSQFDVFFLASFEGIQIK
jgi:hypothetical protein